LGLLRRLGVPNPAFRTQERTIHPVFFGVFGHVRVGLHTVVSREAMGAGETSPGRVQDVSCIWARGKVCRDVTPGIKEMAFPKAQTIRLSLSRLEPKGLPKWALQGRGEQGSTDRAGQLEACGEDLWRIIRVWLWGLRQWAGSWVAP
jgi:hypothetical protein